MLRLPIRLLFAITIPLLLGQQAVRGADRPILGRDGTRNGVSSEAGGPNVMVR